MTPLRITFSLNDVNCLIMAICFCEKFSQRGRPFIIQIHQGGKIDEQSLDAFKKILNALRFDGLRRRLSGAVDFLEQENISDASDIFIFSPKSELEKSACMVACSTIFLHADISLAEESCRGPIFVNVKKTMTMAEVALCYEEALWTRLKANTSTIGRLNQY